MRFLSCLLYISLFFLYPLSLMQNMKRQMAGIKFHGKKQIIYSK